MVAQKILQEILTCKRFEVGRGQKFIMNAIPIKANKYRENLIFCTFSRFLLFSKNKKGNKVFDFIPYIGILY